MTKNQRIDGMTVMERMNDLDEALLAEAELDARFLPATDKKSIRAERRAAWRASGLGRFMSSGLGVACICMIVSLGVLGGIIYAGNMGGGTSPGTNPPVGGTIAEIASDWQAEGAIPFSGKEINYTIRTSERVYTEAPKKITVIATAKNPGEIIPGYSGWHIECLSDPKNTEAIVPFWTEEAIEVLQPAPDEYAKWSKNININGTMPDGIYRVHHMEYDQTTQGYISVAHYEFAVGEDYGKLFLQGALPAEGETIDPDSLPTYEPAAEQPFTIKASITRTEQGAYLSVKYTGAVKGEPILNPSLNISLVKISGAVNPESIQMMTTSEGIAEVHPTDQNDGYAVFSKSHTIQNPDALLPGTYRVYALTWENECICYDDIEWDGKISTAVTIKPTPAKANYDIVMPRTVPAFSESIKVTFKAKAPGEQISTIGILKLEKINGEATEKPVGIMSPDIASGFAPATPDDYAEGTMTYFFDYPQYLTGGTYRISIWQGDTELAYTTFWVDEPVDD